MQRNHYPYFIIAFSLVGFTSLAFLVNSSSQKTQLRGNAQEAYITPQCSQTGKIQFAISFTNPDPFPINLLADILIDTQTISRNYLNVAPGQTRTDLISTNLTSLPNTGDIVFTWSPVTDPSTSNDTAASFNQLTCNPTTPIPTPTLRVSNGEEADSSILALTPLPPQPEITPQPFYQPILNEVTTRVQTLIFNFSRFISAFTK